MNKVKIAYTILMDDAKRDKYDKDLAKKRAEELLQNVSTASEETEEESITGENEEIDELEREVWRIFHQESDEKEKDGDDERFIWQGKMRYLADIVLNMLIMLLPVLLSIMVTGFLIQGGKVFWCRLADLWRGKENKRNF